MAGEQVRKDLASGSRERGVVRRITGKGRHREQGSDARVKHVGPQVPISELPVVACNEGVVVDRCEHRVSPCGARRVRVRLVLEHPLAGIVIPAGEQAGRTLPVESFVVVGEFSLKLPDRIRLGLYGRGLAVGWGRRPEFIGCRQQDRLPVWHGCIAGFVSDPHARPGRDRAGPDRVGAIGLCPRNHLLCHPSPQLQAGGRVARELDTGKDTRLRRFFGHRLERRRLVRKEIGKNRRGGSGGCRVFRWIGGTPRRRQRSRQCRIRLARAGAIVEVLRLPRRDGGVVDRHRQIGVDAVRIGDRLACEKAIVDQVDPSIAGRAGIPERDLGGGLRIVLCDKFAELLQLGCGSIRWGRDSEVLARRDYPRLPRSSLWLYRIRLGESAVP